jgi:8-oxo-dGTP pyrophosphatase MutT (NUDIX family)
VRTRDAGHGQAEVEAAGGVVVREGEDGPIQIAVVHRSRYDDWSLPKGKLMEGESAEDAALREVEEETGIRCELGDELAPAHYRDRKGRRKRVRWWLMRPVSGTFEPNSEVDDLRWLDAPDAIELLDYEHDRELVKALLRD